MWLCAITLGAFLDAAACRLRFLSYESSPWEVTWRTQINSWIDVECNIMAESFHLERALWLVYQCQKIKHERLMNALPKTVFEMNNIFSRFRWLDTETNQIVEHHIEPLVGMLRDPLTMCDALRPVSGVFDPNVESWLQSKRFLLPHFPTSKGRKLLVDLGASLYSGWFDETGAVGAKWFVELYARHNVTFDLIISFEATQHPAMRIFESIPTNLMGHYVFINVPVSSNPGSRFNPWNVLLQSASLDDYVVVKLDIDHPQTEMRLVQQLISNSSLSNLVDEFFFEHHVNSKIMHRYWHTENEQSRMSNSYNLFYNLRNAGIRAHSWP
jgi:hypothetical protein